MAGRKQPTKRQSSSKRRAPQKTSDSSPRIPGEVMLAEAPINANQARTTLELDVTNTGDRPVQVGSHFHFFEVNRALSFDRPSSFGMRLNIPSGNAVRFEPGQTHTVTLVALGGKGLVHGFNNLVSGTVRSDSVRQQATQNAQSWLDRS